MRAAGESRYCRCGARTARDNTSGECAQCRAANRDLALRPPEVPDIFWAHDHVREALAAWHMGRLIRAYRHHPFHGRALPQELVAGWAGITQAQLSRLESGSPITDLAKLVRWARILGVPGRLLWFRLPDDRTEPAAADVVRATASSAPAGIRNEDIDRREVLRLMSLAGTVMAASDLGIDWDRLSYAAGRPRRLDRATLDEYSRLNAHLWRVFVLSRTKTAVMPFVRDQLQALVDALQQSRGGAVRQRVCALAGDLFQLAGEIYFDRGDYTTAQQCYAQATAAAKEARAFDLWACATIRHALVNLHEARFHTARPVLELADAVARRGDRALSTRPWAAAVQAQVAARLGERAACQEKLDVAAHVTQLPPGAHNGGWLRFDGSRLAEERGACYIKLGMLDAAQRSLTEAAEGVLSPRRRAAVLCDLATLGAARGDLDGLTTYAEELLGLVQQTGSGYVVRKAGELARPLSGFTRSRRARELHDRISSVSASTRE